MQDFCCSEKTMEMEIFVHIVGISLWRKLDAFSVLEKKNKLFYYNKTNKKTF